jgi:hypothetical protein
MTQKVLFFSDKDMNDVLKDFNSVHNSDYGFVWCPEYCNLVDFQTNSRIDFDGTVEFAAINLSTKSAHLKKIVDTLLEENELEWSKYFDFYHDASRKTYILYWEEFFGDLGIL